MTFWREPERKDGDCIGRAREDDRHEACHTRHDLELVFPRDRGHRARHVQARGPRGHARAHLSRRQVQCGVARWRGRFCRRVCAFHAGGISAMARRQAPVRAGAGHVLVPGHAPRSRRQARRYRRGEGTAHRRRTLGRDRASPPPDRGRHRPRARWRHDRAGAGRAGRRREFRA